MDLEFLFFTAFGVPVLMIGTWAVSVAIRNASIVDLIWGFGFVVVGWIARLTADGFTARQNLLVVLVTVWGLRLTAYLTWRNHGQGEDYRYVKMREHWGPRFPLISLGTVFGLQGVLMWVVSLPIQLGQGDDEPTSLGVLAVLGTLLWAVGMFFETVGDWQLARFKADPASAGKVMDRGLWSWTRHPNYFGDFCVWWGLGLVALETGWPGVIALIGPVVVSVLLLRVSGKALLERNLKRRRPGYEEYVARTSGFFPRPPRPGRAQALDSHG
jgi:steroid 5-alpha reductase family enzyme